jgi:hypothetical protein
VITSYLIQLHAKNDVNEVLTLTPTAKVVAIAVGLAISVFVVSSSQVITPAYAVKKHQKVYCFTYS